MFGIKSEALIPRIHLRYALLWERKELNKKMGLYTNIVTVKKVDNHFFILSHGENLNFIFLQIKKVDYQ